jgi:RNA polymerase sigma factor for flagellar operon FliA
VSEPGQLPELPEGAMLPDRLDPEIRALVIEMMPQARSEAWKVFSGAPHALDLDELTSLAYTGLMMAAARWPVYCAERGYDPRATNYFAAYALRRIRGAMLDAMRSADWVTRSMRAKAKALREAGQDMGASEGELEKATGLSRKQIRDTLSGVAARPVSFDAEPHDVPDSGDVEGQVVVSSVLEQVLKAMEALDPVTQVILALRFHAGLEFAEIAGRLGISEQQAAEMHNAGVVAVHGVMVKAVT